MIDFKSIRKWTHEQRLNRLGELGEMFRTLWEEEVVPNNLHQDEAVVIWLEIMRSAFPGDSPVDRLHDLVMGYEDPGPAFGVMSMRFRETKELVEQFKNADKRDQMRIRPQLVARGMI